MNEQRRLRVASLAQAESRARRDFENLGRVNTFGLTWAESDELDKSYALARAAWTDALEALLAAVEPGSECLARIKAHEAHSLR